jgi:hypothetical protein
MEATLITLAAILPSIGWVLLCYWWDRKEPEPKLLIMKLFFSGVLLGLLIAVLVVLLQYTLVSSGLFLPFNALSEKDGLASFVVAGAIIAIIHLVAIFWIAKKLVTRNKYFTQITDGIVYFSVIALGAVLSENIITCVNYHFSASAVPQSLKALIFGLVFNSIILGVSAGILGFGFGNVYKRATRDGIIEDNELYASFNNSEIVEGLVIGILFHASYQVFVYLREPRVAGLIGIIGMFYLFTRFAFRSFTEKFQE